MHFTGQGKRQDGHTNTNREGKGMDLDIRQHGTGRTIRRKYQIVNDLDEALDTGIVLHKEVMARDNPYRQGAELDDGLYRLIGHIKGAWLAAGGTELEPPDQARVQINK